MKIAKKTINNSGQKKHLVYFFGLSESIKYHSEYNHIAELFPKEITVHLFDYPHFREIVNPRCTNKNIILGKQILKNLAAFAAISAIGLVFLCKKPISFKIAVFIPSLIIFLIIATYINSNLIVKTILTKNYSDKLSATLSHKEIKRMKMCLTGKTENESDIKKDVNDIINFFCMDEHLLTHIAKFMTRSKDPIIAGVKLVMDLLEQGVHPNDIILMGNSLGDGIATEVLKKFEEEQIYLTLVNSNSFCQLKETVKYLKSPFGQFFQKHPRLLDLWFKLCSLNYDAGETITQSKAPVLVVNRKNDFVIPREAQLAIKLEHTESSALRIIAMLEHDDEQNRDSCAVSNVHVDTIAHMKVSNVNCSYQKEDISSIKSSTTCKEFLENFIDEAHKYLEKEKLNKDFNLSNFKQNKLYKAMKKNGVSLIDIDLQISPIMSGFYLIN
ncbi:hypothetical protein [Candidatus Mesenet endosymbiont of Phosphuga atrata]|uniref:hypothetical protein n=1 Tax=Candidatus Mesenet endosymbiont of Phosphuga atrata TaxID=3066221 RepID=UPI0030D378AD